MSSVCQTRTLRKKEIILVPINEPPGNNAPHNYREKCIKKAIETEYPWAKLTDKLFNTKASEPTM